LDHGVDLKAIEKLSKAPLGKVALMPDSTMLAGIVEFWGEKYPEMVGRVKAGSSSVRFC
jgi:hypothetical protein